jgi:hypothetical protein
MATGKIQTAAIIGNGKSRIGYDLARFTPAGMSVYGCNALYREYYNKFYPVPDYIVAVDNDMIQEIRASGNFPQEKLLVPTTDECWEPAECNPCRPRMNAGMAAMKFAIESGAKRLYCLGFDFLIIDQYLALSNIYDGTANYGPTTRANADDTPGRLHFLEWFMTKYADVDFVFVLPAGAVVHQLFAKNSRFVPFDLFNQPMYFFMVS